jgi:hypothetical protein
MDISLGVDTRGGRGGEGDDPFLGFLSIWGEGGGEGEG